MNLKELRSNPIVDYLLLLISLWFIGLVFGLSFIMAFSIAGIRAITIGY